MVMGPEILILDEPTAQLDPIAAENFLGTLKKINDELGITVILSEHRLDNVLAYGNKVIVMDSGKIQYCGEPYKILEHNIDEDVLKLMPMATRIYYESGMEGADEGSFRTGERGRVWHYCPDQCGRGRAGGSHWGAAAVKGPVSPDPGEWRPQDLLFEVI